MVGLKELDALQLHGLLQEQDRKNLVLLDVRTPAEAARAAFSVRAMSRCIFCR